MAEESDFTESFGASGGGASGDNSEQVFESGDRELPTKIGRYRIDRFLGSGGFGAVYLGFDPQLKRPVAIKVPHADLIANRAIAETYLEEARNVANLDHPHIVPVFDVGSTDEFPCFIVSKFVKGIDLSARQNEHPLSIRESVELVAQVGNALHYAHKQGLVHRDIKPNNLMVDNENLPHIVDFGLALREENVGKGPAFVGTLAYMSPEQARGEGHRVDGRSDVFSLGVVLYFLLVGRRPFRGDSKAELLDQISSYEARPLRQYNDQIPKELERICLKAMSKKATERYSTAKDFADELQLFLGEFAEATTDTRTRAILDAASTLIHQSDPGTTGRPQGQSDTQETADSFQSDSQPFKIIPKGLRSFDSEDYEFFLELIPGAKDRTGIPDVIRFWKSRIEETDPDQTFPVGLIYGPSGCGKSSLVKAGLLPRIANHIIPVYIEASPDETESRLLNRLRKCCPGIDDKLDLKETLGALRKGQGIPAGKKVVIVVDQFEQWLHVTRDEAGVELAQEILTQALRQCDGGRVQCILMVRDDFWMAVTRLLQELEVELLQGHNFASVDLFPIRHAEKVLTAFGSAYGVLADETSVSQSEKEFVKKAVAGLAENGKVISVRLALFAEMMKSRPWTLQSLRELGGTEGVGFSFLEETFSSNSNPKYRLHQKAAQAVLKALLPDTGTDIKGEMKSHDELLKISGYESRPSDFSTLMTILDREIRLVTPTDPEGEDLDLDHLEANDLETNDPESTTKKYYQLTHDYLVHSLRQWLTRKEKESSQGRARIRLQDLSATWKSHPENRYLPSIWDYLRIRVLTDRSKWSESQSKMMKRASLVHGIRSVSIAVVLMLIIWTGFQASHAVNVRQKQQRAKDLVQFLVDADIEKVEAILGDLDNEGLEEFAEPLLEKQFANKNLNEDSKLNIALALLRSQNDQAGFLVEIIPTLSTQQFTVVSESLSKVDSVDLTPLWDFVADSERSNHSRFLAGTALAKLSTDSQRWKKLSPFMANHLTAGVPSSEVFLWINHLKVKSLALSDDLADIIRDRKPARAKQRETACLVLGRYLEGQPRDLIPSLLVADELYEHRALFAAIKPNADQVIPELRKTLEAVVSRASEQERDEMLGAKSIAAVTLIKLNLGQEVWPYLKHSPDPSLRSFIVRQCIQLQVDSDKLLNLSSITKDDSIRRALILCAGHYQHTDPPSNKWIERLKAIYQHDTDPGVHAAARFTLLQWKEKLPEIEEGLRRIPPERISNVQKLEKDVDYTRKQLELSIKQLPEIRRQWESKFVSTDDSIAELNSKLDDGLVIYFPFDEKTGNLFANSANANEPGRFVGADEPERVPGVGGSALRFDGENHGIVSGRAFNPGLSDSFSMGCWIYFEDEGQVGSIISKMDGGGIAIRGFDLWFEAGQIGAHFKHEYPTNMYKVLTSTPIVRDRWHHVWVAYDGSATNAQIRVYVNGKLKSIDLIHNSLRDNFKTDSPIRIGCRNDPRTQESFPFGGLIDEVRIYDRILSAEEVQLLYRNGLRKVVSVPSDDRSKQQEQLVEKAQQEESSQLKNLRKLYTEKRVLASKARWQGRSRWFVNNHQQTMVVIPQMEIDGEIPIPYDFAIGAFEVTSAEFKKHNPTPGFLTEIVPTDDCPAHQLNWYDAAKYCNWLTENDESIPPGQEIYLKNEQGQWGPGVKIKPNYKELAGYRLPTAEEWDFAAKALSKRQYYFGEPEALLENYGWYASNSKARSYPVGSLLPNDFGLFDVQGNVWEWVLNIRGDKPGEGIQGVRRILGGGLNYLPSAQRSENSFYNTAENRNMYFGFRIVRMIPASGDY